MELESYFGLSNKVRDLMELESDFGSSGREAAYRETGQRLQLELSGALKWLRFVESSRQLETSQALQAIAHAEREPRPREAYVPQIASPPEGAQAQSQAQASMTIEVAREALALAAGAAQAEAKARQAEAAAAAEQFKELTNELLR